MQEDGKLFAKWSRGTVRRLQGVHSYLDKARTEPPPAPQDGPRVPQSTHHGWGCHPLHLAALDVLVDASPERTPLLRGSHLAKDMYEAMTGRSASPSPQARWVLESLVGVGLTPHVSEAPLVSFEHGFATFMDLLCTDTQGRLVVVEIKHACGGTGWLCGCLGAVAEGGDHHTSEPWFAGPLRGLPGCAPGRAAAQAKLALLALHQEYHIPSHQLAWAVAVFCGVGVSMCILCGDLGHD